MKEDEDIYSCSYILLHTSTPTYFYSYILLLLLVLLRFSAIIKYVQDSSGDRNPSPTFVKALQRRHIANMFCVFGGLPKLGVPFWGSQ